MHQRPGQTNGAGPADGVGTDAALRMVGATGLRGTPALPPAGRYTIFDLVPLAITRSGEVPLTVDGDQLVRDLRFVKVSFRDPELPPGAQVWAGNVTLRVGDQDLQRTVNQFGLPVEGSIETTGTLPTAAKPSQISKLKSPSQLLADAGVPPLKRQEALGITPSFPAESAPVAGETGDNVDGAAVDEGGEEAPPLFNACDLCNGSDRPARYACGGCRRALYCGARCQELDWVGGHRRKCASGSGGRRALVSAPAPSSSSSADFGCAGYEDAAAAAATASVGRSLGPGPTSVAIRPEAKWVGVHVGGNASPLARPFSFAVNGAAFNRLNRVETITVSAPAVSEFALTVRLSPGTDGDDAAIGVEVFANDDPAAPVAIRAVTYPDFGPGGFDAGFDFVAPPTEFDFRRRPRIETSRLSSFFTTGHGFLPPVLPSTVQLNFGPGGFDAADAPPASVDVRTAEAPKTQWLKRVLLLELVKRVPAGRLAEFEATFVQPYAGSVGGMFFCWPEVRAKIVANSQLVSRGQQFIDSVDRWFAAIRANPDAVLQ